MTDAYRDNSNFCQMMMTVVVQMFLCGVRHALLPLFLSELARKSVSTGK
jgi:hypothetical protein